MAAEMADGRLAPVIIGAAVTQTAAATPERAALQRGSTVLTYGELAQRIDRVATALQRTHPRLCKPGERSEHVVALLIDDPIELLVAFLGTVRAGGVAAPLSTMWSAEQVDRAVALARPLTVLDSTVLAELEREEADAPAPARVLNPDGAFYAGFTSGSTGEPRAVVRSHTAWTRSFDAMSTAFAIPDGARVLVPGSLFFSFSLIAALHALHTGGTVVVPEEDGPRGLLDAFEAGADAAHVLPSLLHDALRLAARQQRRFDAIGTIICAGEPLPAETRTLVAERCPGAALCEYYGASELGFVTLLTPADAAAHPGSVGRPFPGSEVAILDSEGRHLPPGELGLLCARTPYGGTHYLGGALLDDALGHHGWRTVGDLARADAAGYVTLAGRRDRMVVIRGENIYPEETERVLLACPGVARAAVVAMPAARPTHLVAAVEPVEAALDVGAVQEAVRALLPPRKRPRRIVTIPAMPLTGTGKIDLARVRALLGD